MKPPAFRYLAPQTLSETLGRLTELGDEAKILAGGQSLMPVLNFRLSQPGVLVDINRVAELNTYTVAPAGITIGAIRRQRDVELHPTIADDHPLLAETLPLMSHPAIRNRGTICGSLAHADPAAELPAVAIATGATFTLQRQGETRTVTADEFFVTALMTALEGDELLTAVTFPRWAAGDGWSIVEFARRHGDYALVGAVVTLSPVEGRIGRARAVLFGTGDRPQTLERVEDLVAGEPLSEALLAEAVQRTRADTEANDDVQASASYRRYVAGTMVGRAIRRAAERAGLGAGG